MAGAGAFALLLSVAGDALAVPKVTPSGFPVPRYITLKFGKVNARRGPGEDYPLMWVYTARGLPLQVVAETAEWRRVCDPTGGAAWIHKRATDGARSAMRVAAQPAVLRAKPEANGRVVAYLRPQSFAALDRCDKGWCRLKAGGVTGWTPEREVWGTDPKAQCR